jgi:hypothetical protein
MVNSYFRHLPLYQRVFGTHFQLDLRMEGFLIILLFYYFFLFFFLILFNVFLFALLFIYLFVRLFFDYF